MGTIHFFVKQMCEEAGLAEAYFFLLEIPGEWKEGLAVFIRNSKKILRTGRSFFRKIFGTDL